MAKQKIVYVVGAGLSAGLDFPVIGDLLPKIWGRLEAAGTSIPLAKVIRFHHPDFNPAAPETYPTIEQLLSEMAANAELFDSSRPATGTFTSTELLNTQRDLLLELAGWFHELQRKALRKTPEWFSSLAESMKTQGAQIISFNWDLLLDKVLFGSDLAKSSYGLDPSYEGVKLLKPHGSLNWYERRTGRYLSEDKKFSLYGEGASEVFSFKPFRAVISTRRQYMPLIIPPMYAKRFDNELFVHIWREAVSALSTATDVRFLGYSLPDADFHARFILRCGFHNQESGLLTEDGKRAEPTGRAKVTIVDPAGRKGGPGRIERATGWQCKVYKQTVEEWILSGGLTKA